MYIYIYIYIYTYIYIYYVYAWILIPTKKLVRTNLGCSSRTKNTSFRQVFDESTSTDGGPFSAYANTTNTILGAGTLAVPIAMSSAGLLSYLLMTAGVISVHSMTATGSCFFWEVDGGTYWRGVDVAMARLELLLFMPVRCDCDLERLKCLDEQQSKMGGKRPWFHVVAPRGQLVGDGGRLLTQRCCKELWRHCSRISWHLCCPHETWLRSCAFQGC